MYWLAASVLGVACWQQSAWLLPAVVQAAPAKRDQAGDNPALPVLTQAVRLTSNDINFKATGIAQARYSAELYPAVAEQVEQLLFSAGQQVKSGQLLLQLDDRAEQLALRQALLVLKDAKALQQRYRLAAAQGGISERELEDATAAMEQAQLAVEQAQLDISEREIIAPFAGSVGMTRVDVGDRVQTNTLVTTVDDQRQLYLDFELPESLFSAMQQDAQRQLQASTPAYPGKTFIAQVRQLDNRVNPENASLLVRAVLDNAHGQFRPGMSFQLLWQVAGKSYPTVPEIALQWGRQGPYIWLVRDNQAVKTVVQVVNRRAGQVLLDGDVQVDEPVVIEGVQRLRAGSEVRLLGKPQP